MDGQNGPMKGRRHSMEAWMLKMEPQRLCVVADSHHIDEKLDPDPHQIENFDLDPYL